MYINNTKLTLRQHFKIIKKVFKVDKILSGKKLIYWLCFLVLVESYRKKKKSLTNGLITLYILLTSKGRRTRPYSWSWIMSWMTKLILQIRCPSYHLASGKKSAQIQKPSTQISDTFHRHGVVEKTKNDLAINALGIAHWIVQLYWTVW